MEESAKAEFDDIVAERDVVGQLNELDRLVGEARYRRDHGVGEGNVAWVFPISFGSFFLWIIGFANACLVLPLDLIRLVRRSFIKHTLPRIYKRRRRR